MPHTPESPRWGEFYLKAGDDPATVFQAMQLDCRLLRETAGVSEPALAPDDQLQLVISLEDSKKPTITLKPIITLRFDVVAAPDMPANQSSFGLLMLKPDGKSVRMHMFAPGPDAAVIELVDPLDLVEGVVRRRAIYQWRSFHDAVELDYAVNPVRFALQKIGGVGESWLPTEVEVSSTGGAVDAPETALIRQSNGSSRRR